MSDVLCAIESEDWTAFAKLVHPYVSWTEDGHTTRGRTRVMAMLAGRAHTSGSHTAPPAREYEMRDGQVYQWTA
ncbi:nuclear transport factor 2 family protein [Nocardia uniformis]|uniref:nuclear transport factor 2 family protein n=1 Tax=Nocardia uniformis TaxID=53432 RepID=UPI000A6BD1DD|nr:nuclear transport factor 2 family protein [Nocardia uniformis]